MFLNSWDWSTNNKIESDSLRIGTLRMMTTLYNEKFIKDKIAERGEFYSWQNIKLYSRRGILISINLAFNIACIWGIIYSNMHKVDI